jgi:hypothetical protein
LQRLFGGMRGAPKVSQPFDPLPLTHNHHPSIKHPLNGGFQQNVPYEVLHELSTVPQISANQSHHVTPCCKPVDIFELGRSSASQRSKSQRTNKPLNNIDKTRAHAHFVRSVNFVTAASRAIGKLG